MLDEKNLEKLKAIYKIPEHELMEMGLVKPKTKTLCTRITKAEHEKIYRISIDTKDFDSMSDIIRAYISEMVRSGYMDVEGVKKLKSKRIRKSNASHISVKIIKPLAKSFEELCMENYVKPATVLRFIVRMINKREGGRRK